MNQPSTQVEWEIGAQAAQKTAHWRQLTSVLFANPYLWVLLLLCCVSSLVISSSPVTDTAYGCDPFGYLHSAQMFHNSGFAGGFDTRVKNEEANFLIQTAKSTGLTSDEFSQIIAPHGFHYCPATNSIIHQYPPGTGLILWLFHPGRRIQWLLILGMGMVSLPFLLVAATHRLRPIDAFAFLAIILAADQLILDSIVINASYSVPLTIALIPIAVWSAIKTASSSSVERWLCGALLGLTSALLLLTRVPNLFIVAGLVCFLIVRLFFQLKNKIVMSVGPSGLAVLLAVFCGEIPLLLFNRINAGGFLASTYAAVDTQPPQFTWSLIKQDLHYFFRESYAWQVTMAALLVLLCTVLAGLRGNSRSRRQTLIATAVAGSVTYVVNLVYFCTHQVRVAYYMAPGCFFVLVLGILVFAEKKPARNRVTSGHVWRVAAVLLLLGACVHFELRHFRPEIIKPTAPAELTARRSIVWADLTSGTLLYYNQKYAAKLIAGAPCVQDRMIQAVSDAGRPQYFIDDSPSMQSIITRLSADADLKVVGTYNAFGDNPVYELVNLKHPLTCSL